MLGTQPLRLQRTLLGREVYDTRTRHARSVSLPWGYWRYKNGLLRSFNRYQEPLFDYGPDTDLAGHPIVRQAPIHTTRGVQWLDPDIEDVVEERFFYNDSDHEHQKQDKAVRGQEWLMGKPIAKPKPGRRYP